MTWKTELLSICKFGISPMFVRFLLNDNARCHVAGIWKEFFNQDHILVFVVRFILTLTTNWASPGWTWKTRTSSSEHTTNFWKSEKHPTRNYPFLWVVDMREAILVIGEQKWTLRIFFSILYVFCWIMKFDIIDCNMYVDRL